MTWEEKLAALNALSETVLTMREPGKWHCSVRSAEIGGDSVLQSIGGRGQSPEEAVLNAWAMATEWKPPKRYIALNAYSDGRRQVKWNGYMWVEVK